jgi:class 3 adenylate cyclase/CHASE2 domain-containing sensor protein
MPSAHAPVTTRTKVVWIGFLLLLAYGAAAPHVPLSRFLDAKILDAQFRWLHAYAPKPAAHDVVIVGIDEQTTRELYEPIALWHPHLGKFFEAMALARPAVVGLDVVFPDRSYDRLLREYDRPLIAGLLALRAGGIPLALGQTVDEQGRLRQIFPPILAVAGPDGLGLVLFPLDSDDVARRYRPSFDADDSMDGGGRTPSGTGVGGNERPTLAMRMGIPLGAKPDAGLIDYGIGPAYPYIPLQQVLAWRNAGDVVRLRKAFGGKPVLLGSVMPFIDRYTTPVALAAWEPGEYRVPGMLVHAQALRSLVNGGFIHAAPWWLTALLPVLAALLWWIGQRPPWALGAALLGLVAAAIISTWLLRNGTHLPVAGALFTGYAAMLARNGVESFFNLREKRRLRDSFGRYVSPPVLDEILAGRIQAGLGGARREVCVLFSDIRGFTRRSEGQAPEAVIAFLNRYFTEMVAAIHAHGGTLDKFIGDGIMAFFGAPAPRTNAAQDAFACAREMLTRLDRLNETLAAEGIEPIRIGIGLHRGEVLVGHIGSETRHEYSAIGDPVNVASRLESLTKEVGYPIVVSHEVAEKLASRDGLVELGAHAIKGHTPVAVFGYRPAG